MKWACTQWLDAGASLTAVCTCTVPRFHWGQAGMSVGPSKAALHRRELHWPLGAIQQNICTITDIVIYHRHHSSDPNIGGTVTSPGCVHWVLRNPDVGVSGLMLLFPGECGWMVVLYFFFSFVSKYLEHLELQLLYILKPLFLYPSCCTVTLNVFQMNEKLIRIRCLSFSGTTLGFS